MSEEDEVILTSRPLNDKEKVLLQKYAESVAGQSALMDELAKQIITIELAIPGLYVTVLQLTRGQDGTVSADNWFVITFICWLISLALAIFAILPLDYDVDESMLESDPNDKSKQLSIRDFFRKSATFKRTLLILSIIVFMLGVFSAAYVFL